MHKITHTRQFMKTGITISVIKTDADSTVQIQSAIEEAFSQFDRIVQKYTRFEPTSELSVLNQNSGNWHPVSSEFLMLISTMLEYAAATDGAFDPTVIDYLETYGYDRNYDFSKLDKPELDKIVDKISQNRKSWRDIELDREKFLVKLAPSQRIDLGGIGKGYAIDQAYEQLLQFENFMIDAGGDVRVRGHNEHGEPWSMGLAHRSEGEHKTVIGVVSSTDMALAGSGSWARRVKQFHHIINPSTGKPVEDMRTVYVSAPTATQADAWATSLFVGGRELLSKLPASVEALMIDSKNKVIKTKKFSLVS